MQDQPFSDPVEYAILERPSSTEEVLPSWWSSFVAWDGILPLIVAAIPSAIKLFFPKNDIARIVAALLIPMAAALLRSIVGAQQIRERCAGTLPRSRQIAPATAIVLLMLFEMCVSIMTFAVGVPASVWLIPLSFYVAYLAAIFVAFIPQTTR
jgi:hypothetical protein